MANDFSGDSRFVSLWSLENDGQGAVSGADSIGSNDLTVVGAALTTTREEGSHAALFEGSDYLYRSDTNLSSNFPFKSGANNKDAFICFRYRPSSIASRYYIWSKYRAQTGGRSFLIRQDTDGGIDVLIGYGDASAFVTASHETVLPAANEWYHVQVWYSDTAGSDDKGWCKIKIKRQSTGQYLGTTLVYNTDQHININNQELCIGAQSGSHGDDYRGIIDEIVVANTIDVSEAEADAIAQQTFGAPLSEAPTCTITSPTSNPTYDNGSSSTISLAGTASDDVEVTQVTWSNDRGGSGTATGTTSWSISNITLQSGQNVITVTAHDEDENTGTDTITVTYTPSSGVTLDSNFDSGNGVEASVFESPAGTFNVKTVKDAPSNNWSDWFFFKLSGVEGLAPVVKVDYNAPSRWSSAHGNVRPVWSYDGATWSRLSSIDSYSSGILTFTLPEMEEDDVYIAMDIPYTWAMVQADVADWAESPYCTVTSLAYGGVTGTPGGRPIYHMRIEDTESPYINKLHIVITCRAHPGEPQPSWSLKGMMDWILSSDSSAAALRGKVVLDVFPCVNPDGVYMGKLRSFANGTTDGNRGWNVNGPSSSLEPNEAFLVHSKIHEVAADVDFCIDLHSSEWTYVALCEDAAGTCPRFGTAKETALKNAVDTYDTPNYFAADVLYRYDADTSTTSAALRYGQGIQYGYPHILMEGGIYTSAAGIYPTSAQREAGGVILLRSAIEALEESGIIRRADCVEALGFSDTAGRAAIFQGMCAEALALSALPGPQATLGGIASESMVLSDQAARSMRISVVVEEPLALGAAAAGQATLLAQAVDTLTLSEALAVTGIYLAAASELLAFSDAAEGAVEGEGIIQGDCMETIAFAAGASARLDALASVLETMGLSGSASAILHAAAGAVETMAFSDVAAWGAMIQALAEEGLLFSDEASATMTMIGQAIEALAFSDGALPRMAFTVEAFEALSFRDAVAAIARFGAVCSETIGFFDMAVHFEPKGMVTITFESKKGSITFSLKKGTITFQ